MKRFIRLYLTVGTYLAIAAYLFSCLTSYISPARLGLLTYLELAFPYLALSILLLVIVWIFIKRKLAIILLVVFALGYRNLTATVAVNMHPAKMEVSGHTGLKILCWNVKGFDNPAFFVDTPQSLRRKMFSYIKQSGADILCLQEFNEHNGQGMFSNTEELVKLGYRYYFRTNDVSRVYPYGIITGSSAIFSRIPLLDTGKTVLGDSSFPEHIGFADVLLANKRFRIFTAHFKSLNLHAEYTDSISVVPFHGDSSFVYKASRLEKIKVFSQEHARQAEIARTQFSRSPYPFIFGGDLNSVPTSYAYHTISQGLQDAFLTMGCGLGTTFYTLPTKLRIDYLLVHKTVAIQHYRLDQVELSDHYPQMIEVNWKN